MSAATITLILGILDLLVKAEPGIVALVREIKQTIANNGEVQQTLKQITDDTIQVSAETRAALAQLLSQAA
jgi:hypothetical protein